MALPSGIELRGDTYRVRVRRRGYPEQTATFPTLAKARAWKSQIEAEMASGMFVDASNLRSTTLADLILRYVEEETPKKKGAEAETYVLEALAENKLCKHTLDKFADGVLAASIRKDLEAVKTKKGTTRKPATILRNLACLSSVCRHAIRNWGFPAFRNPFQGIDKPLLTRATSRRNRLATDDELNAIAKETGSLLLPTFATVAVETAARRSELIRLRWEDIDFDESLMTVHDSKNGDARTIPVPSHAMKLLAAFKKNDIAGGKGFVFKGVPQGNERPAPADYPHIAKDTPTRAFIRARERAAEKFPSIKELRLHDLRHTAATNLSALNGFGAAFTVVDLAAITGHRDVNTLARYLHPKPTDLRDRIEAAKKKRNAVIERKKKTRA